MQRDERVRLVEDLEDLGARDGGCEGQLQPGAAALAAPDGGLGGGAREGSGGLVRGLEGGRGRRTSRLW